MSIHNKKYMHWLSQKMSDLTEHKAKLMSFFLYFQESQALNRNVFYW